MSKRNFVKILTLSLVLAGASGLYLAPRALAADQDTTATVTTAGTYNSVVVKNTGTRDDQGYLCGVKYEGTEVLTLTGAKKIEVSDDGHVYDSELKAQACGMQGNGKSKLTSTGASPMVIKANSIIEGTVTNHRVKSNVYGVKDVIVEGDWSLQVAAKETGSIDVAPTKTEQYAHVNAKGIHGGGFTGNLLNSTVEAIGGKVITNNGNLYEDVRATGIDRLDGKDIGTVKNMSVRAEGHQVVVQSSAGAAYTLDGLSTSAWGMYADEDANFKDLDMQVEAKGGSIELESGAKISALYGITEAVGIESSKDDDLDINGALNLDVKAEGATLIDTTNIMVGKTCELSTIAKGVEGGLEANDDVTIKVAATPKVANSYFRAYSLYLEDKGNINIKSPGKKIVLEGDVHSEERHCQLVLDNKESYLQGNVTKGETGSNKITLSNGGTWRPVYDNRYGTECEWGEVSDKNNPDNKVDARRIDTLTLNKDGIVDLTWDGWTGSTYDTAHGYRAGTNKGYRTLTIDKLSGSDGIIRLDTDLQNNKGDKVIVGENSDATSLKLQINYDPYYDNPTGPLNSGFAIVEDLSGNLAISCAAAEYNEKSFEFDIEKDNGEWKITGMNESGSGGDTPTPTPTPSTVTENTKHALDVAHNMSSAWLVETNSLTKRLGDLRSMNMAAEDSFWGKYAHGTLKVGDGRTTDLQYNQFQLGYDKGFQQAGGKLYRGVVVSRIDGNASYTRGSGDTDGTTLGLYQAWLGDKGHYYDVTLRYGRLDNKYNVTDMSDNYSTGDYKAWATTVSGEYGYRYALADDTYVEPSAEFIYGHIGGADYTTSKKMAVHVDSSNHAIARLGVQVGKQLGAHSAYARANYYHDFAGDSGVTTGTVSYDNGQAKNWFELGLGGNVQLSKVSTAYLEVKKMFGDVKSNVDFGVGARFSF